MRIDDFVNTYTPIELEKIKERKDTRNKPSRKELMGKVLNSIGNFYVVGEKCTHKEVSPEKAAKILHDAFSTQSGFSKCIVAPKRNMTPKKLLTRSKTAKEH